MHKRTALLSILVFSLLAACNLRDGEIKTTTPLCSANELTAPINLRPSLSEIVDIARPQFTWSFSPDSNCTAGIFHVIVGTDPTFKVDTVVISDSILHH
jgi:hypothetical protein